MYFFSYLYCSKFISICSSCDVDDGYKLSIKCIEIDCKYFIYFDIIVCIIKV